MRSSAKGILTVVSTGRASEDESYAQFKAVFGEASTPGATRKVFCVLGGPGSGKGTQGKLLAAQALMDHMMFSHEIASCLHTAARGAAWRSAA